MDRRELYRFQLITRSRYDLRKSGWKNCAVGEVNCYMVIS